MIAKAFGGAAIAALLLSLTPAPASAAQGESCVSGPQAQAAPKQKKKGFGLGSILKAANSAGVGNLLGSGGMLGNGVTGQIAGAVAGTAVSAAGGDASSASGLPSQVAGLAGSHRLAQVTGAVTGTAAQLARSAPRSSRSTDQAPAACAADLGAVVNIYK